MTPPPPPRPIPLPTDLRLPASHRKKAGVRTKSMLTVEPVKILWDLGSSIMLLHDQSCNSNEPGIWGHVQAYSNSLVDFHMVLDLLPGLAGAFFSRRLPANLTYGQVHTRCPTHARRFSPLRPLTFQTSHPDVSTDFLLLAADWLAHSCCGGRNHQILCL